MRRGYFWVAFTVVLVAGSFLGYHSPELEAHGARKERHRVVIVGPSGEEIFTDVFGLSHEVVSPPEPTSGVPTGERRHSPLKITKAVDKTSGMLLEAMLTGARLGSVEVRSFRRVRGRWATVRIIRLEGAFVTSVGQKPGRDDADSGVPLLEEIAFSYQRINWTFGEGGTQHEDSWSSEE